MRFGTSRLGVDVDVDVENGTTTAKRCEVFIFNSLCFFEVAETGHKSSILITYEHVRFDEINKENRVLKKERRRKRIFKIRYKFESQHFGAKISVHLVEIFVFLFENLVSLYQSTITTK